MNMKYSVKSMLEDAQGYCSEQLSKLATVQGGVDMKAFVNTCVSKLQTFYDNRPARVADEVNELWHTCQERFFPSVQKSTVPDADPALVPDPIAETGRSLLWYLKLLDMRIRGQIAHASAGYRTV